MKTAETVQPGLSMLFTLQIELLSNKVMYFAIDPAIKNWLEKWLAEGPRDDVPATDCFLCFPSSSGRVNFIHLKEVKKINFSLNEIENVNVYYDNFNLCSAQQGGIIRCDTQSSAAFLPSMIVELRNRQDLLVFSQLDPELNRVDLNEVNLWQPFFFKSGFLTVFDKAGSGDFIPVTNIACFEICVSLVSPQNPWEDFEEF